MSADGNLLKSLEDKAKARQSIKDSTQTKPFHQMCEPLTPLPHGKHPNFWPFFTRTKLTCSSTDNSPWIWALSGGILKNSAISLNICQGNEKHKSDYTLIWFQTFPSHFIYILEYCRCYISTNQILKLHSVDKNKQNPYRTSLYWDYKVWFLKERSDEQKPVE